MNELSTCELPAAEVGDCTHTFILRSLETPSPKTKENITITVTGLKGQLQEKPFLTVFNQDNKPYTPAFVNSREQSQFQSHSGEYRLQFENKIRKSRELEKGQKGDAIDGGLPQPELHYCFVCKQKFDFYMKHISHQIHHKNIEHSIGNIYIQGLIVEMNRRRQKEREVAKMEKAFQRHGKKQTKLSASSIDLHRFPKQDVVGH